MSGHRSDAGPSQTYTWKRLELGSVTLSISENYNSRLTVDPKDRHGRTLKQPKTELQPSNTYREQVPSRVVLQNSSEFLCFLTELVW